MHAVDSHIPKYRHYKPKDLAVVRIDGRDYYLGKFGSPESHEKYHRLLAEWRARGKLTPPAAKDAEPIGGALTVAAAVHIPETDAAVCFYGITPKEFADPAKIRVPFQGHFANRDDWCTPAAVDALESALKSAGAPSGGIWPISTPDVLRTTSAGCSARWLRSRRSLTALSERSYIFAV